MWERELLPVGSPVPPKADEWEFPLEVVPDWDAQVRRGEEVCRLIDRHLNYEARGRMLLDLNDFRPGNLCPEQRVQMVSDLYASVRPESEPAEGAGPGTRLAAQ